MFLLFKKVRDEGSWRSVDAFSEEGASSRKYRKILDLFPDQTRPVKLLKINSPMRFYFVFTFFSRFCFFYHDARDQFIISCLTPFNCSVLVLQIGLFKVKM